MRFSQMLRLCLVLLVAVAATHANSLRRKATASKPTAVLRFKRPDSSSPTGLVEDAFQLRIKRKADGNFKVSVAEYIEPGTELQQLNRDKRTIDLNIFQVIFQIIRWIIGLLTKDNSMETMADTISAEIDNIFR